MNSWLSATLHYLLVGDCDYCKKPLQGKDFTRICLRCVTKLDNNKNISTCSKCSNKLIDGVCFSCQSFTDGDKHYDNLSLFFNEGMAQEFIYDYKFKRHLSYSKIIALMIQKKYKEYINSFDIFVPIPLGKNGLFERDFCQVTVVVKKLAILFNKKMIKCIRRNEKDYQGHQHSLGVVERKKNINKKYCYLSKYEKKLNKKKVLIFDDIHTTGSTLDFAGKLIEENNNQVKIACFTFSKTIYKLLKNK